jgi:hypothetical protein
MTDYWNMGLHGSGPQWTCVSSRGGADANIGDTECATVSALPISASIGLYRTVRAC